MSILVKLLVGLGIALPLSAYALGSIVATADEPTPPETIVIEDAGSPAPAQDAGKDDRKAGKPGDKKDDGQGDDARRDDDDNDDAGRDDSDDDEVVTPDPDDVDDSGDDAGRDGNDHGDDDDDDDDDNSGPGSDNSGSGSDNSGPGGDDD
jgi:hypothetical protein